MDTQFCNRCGATEFENIEGLFYCQNCGQQIAVSQKYFFEGLFNNFLIKIITDNGRKIIDYDLL